MSKISYIGSIDSKIQNNEMLKFANVTKPGEGAELSPAENPKTCRKIEVFGL